MKFKTFITYILSINSLAVDLKKGEKKWPRLDSHIGYHQVGTRLKISSGGDWTQGYYQMGTRLLRYHQVGIRI